MISSSRLKTNEAQRHSSPQGRCAEILQGVPRPQTKLKAFGPRTLEPSKLQLNDSCRMVPRQDTGNPAQFFAKPPCHAERLLCDKSVEGICELAVGFHDCISQAEAVRTRSAVVGGCEGMHGVTWVSCWALRLSGFPAHSLALFVD